MTCGKNPGDVRCCSRWRRQPFSLQRSWTRGRNLSRISTSTNLLCGNVCSVFVLNQTNYCERTRQTTADDGRRTPEDSTLVVFRRRPLSLFLLAASAGPLVPTVRARLLLLFVVVTVVVVVMIPAGPWSCSCCSSLPSCATTTERTQSRFFSPACRRYEKRHQFIMSIFVFFVISYFLAGRHHLRS
jgi:hypothetical protein